MKVRFTVSILVCVLFFSSPNIFYQRKSQINPFHWHEMHDAHTKQTTGIWYAFLLKFQMQCSNETFIIHFWYQFSGSFSSSLSACFWIPSEMRLMCKNRVISESAQRILESYHSLIANKSTHIFFPCHKVSIVFADTWNGLALILSILKTKMIAKQNKTQPNQIHLVMNESTAIRFISIWQFQINSAFSSLHSRCALRT